MFRSLIKVPVMILIMYFMYLMVFLICFRNLRNFGIVPTDTTTWWKAGIGIAIATAFGFLVVKVLNTTERIVR